MKKHTSLMAATVACLLFLAPVSVLAMENESIASEATEEIQPRNIETWAGYGSFGYNMYNGVQVYAVMTYANGNWGTRAQIVSATGECADARIASTWRQGNGVVGVSVYCASINRSFTILVNVTPV